MLAQAVNRTSGRSGSASEDDPAERGCSRSRTTLGSTPTTPGWSHMIASLGGRYDPWPVKRSTDWLTDVIFTILMTYILVKTVTTVVTTTVLDSTICVYTSVVPLPVNMLQVYTLGCYYWSWYLAWRGRQQNINNNKVNVTYFQFRLQVCSYRVVAIICLFRVVGTG